MIFAEFYNRTKQAIFEQKLKGTYSDQRPARSFVTVLLLGVANIIFGTYLLLSYLKVNTRTIMYSSDMNTPVYLTEGRSYIYIGVDGVYQNYLSYTKSISYSQLKGKDVYSGLSNTDPYDFLDDIPYYPAGAIAATYFQDEITLENLTIKTEDIARDNEKSNIGIAQFSKEDLEIPENWTKSTNENTVPLNTEKETGIPILNERFVNWIVLSGFSKFKKLWGHVDVKSAGIYNLNIISKYKFADNKEIVISEKSSLGIPNYYSPFTMFFIGTVSIISAVYLMVRGY